MDDGQIIFFDLMVFHLATEGARGTACFCDERESTGLTVESVDEGDLPAVHSFVGEKVLKPVPERAEVPGFAGMSRHEGGFVDDHPRVRFPNDLR